MDLVGFCADGFIPAAFDVTHALQPTHTHTLAVLLMDSPVCCHGLFREVSLEARPPAHIVILCRWRPTTGARVL